MPIHDWTRVDSGMFHAFHQRWITYLSDALNAGCLPPEYFAMPEQNIAGPIPDVLTLNLPCDPNDTSEPSGGLAVATAPPRTRHIRRSVAEIYARKADRIVVRHRHGKVVAIVEIVSRGNKASNVELRAFVEKAASLLRLNVNLLIVDLFPPGKRDPQGIHKAIWDELDDEEFELPPDKPLTLVSYDANTEITAYIEPVSVGDTLPDMPLFLRPDIYIPTPLEKTYQTTWELSPRHLKGLLELPAVHSSSNGKAQ